MMQHSPEQREISRILSVTIYLSLERKNGLLLGCRSKQTSRSTLMKFISLQNFVLYVKKLS
jgi:hypothetical protein